MSFTVINGTHTVGEIPRTVAEGYLSIIEELAFGNAKESTANVAGLNVFDNMIREIPGKEGMRLQSKYSNLKFTDDGLATTSSAFKEYTKEFTLTRKGYQIKDFNFSIEFMSRAVEDKTDVMQMAREKTAECANLYRMKYLPAVKLQTLFTGDSARVVVPALGTGQDYEYQFGALRGETVSNLKAWISGGIAVRNHFRAIELATGVTADDIEFCKSYLQDYQDYSGRGIRCVGNGRTLWKLKGVYAYAANTDKYMVDGLPTEKVAGTEFVESEWFPDDIVMFQDIEAMGTIVRLVSPEPAMRGIYLVSETGFQAMTEPEQLSGSLLKIGKEGFHAILRSKYLFLDINKTNYSADRLMQAAGFTAINNFVSGLVSSWYTSVI